MANEEINYFKSAEDTMKKLLEKVAVMETKLKKFEELEERISHIDEIEDRLLRLEETEARIVNLEASISRVFKTFVPKVEALLQSLNGATAIKGNAVSSSAGSNAPNLILSLHDAAKVGDIDTVKLLGSSGTSLNEADAHGYTPLHYASENNRVQIAQELVQCGIHVDVINQRFQTPLMIAASQGCREMVDFLLQCGASVRNVDSEEHTPLWYASCNGHTDIVKILANKEISLFGDCFPNEAAVIAAEKGLVDIVCFFEYTPCITYEPLQALNATNDPKVVRVIAGSDPEEFWGLLGEEAIMHATRNMHLDALETMLRLGANPNWTDRFMYTPLHAAASKNNTEAMLLLLKHGANTEARDNMGRTPLHLAAIHDNWKAIRALLCKGASLTATDDKGRTPREAAKNGSLRVVL